MMSAIRTVSLALAATIVAMTASSAQSPNTPAPQPVVSAPPLSVPLGQYFLEHPAEWQDFLSRLAQQQQQQPAAAPQIVPAGGTWVSVNSTPSVNFMAPQLLTDGTVIFNTNCNGNGGIWYKLTPSINGGYIDGAWSQIATLPVINGAQYSPRYYASETLPNGEVLIMGGEYETNGNCNQQVWTNNGAIYNPDNNTWTAVAPPSGWAIPGIGDAQSVLLADGLYMLANSQSAQQAIALLGWGTTGTGKADGNDEEGWTLLPNGKVLTVDAYVNTGTCGTNSEIFDPATGAWTSAGSTIVQLPDCGGVQSFELGPQVLRPGRAGSPANGTVVAFGGTTTGAAHTAIYVLANGTWTQGPDIPSVCGSNGTTPCTLADAPAALLTNGNILFAASTSNWPAKGSFLSGTHFFEFDFSSLTITQEPDTSDSPSNASYVYNFVMLPNGDVLSTNQGPNVRLYAPANQNNYPASWQPIVSWAPDCVRPGSTYVLSGFQLNGLSHGAAYGDDYQSNTNFPLVKIVNNGTGHVFYGKTFTTYNLSARSVAPNSMETTSFTAASTTENGASTLYVIANGIPSAGTAIDVENLLCPATTSLASAHDFFFNGNSDILWRNTNGAVAMWEMFDGNINQNGGVANVPTTWSIIGQRDFNGDGMVDLLWRDTSGNVAMWFMNGLTVSSSASVANVPTNWTVYGTGDLNGDGKGDLLWYCTVTGTGICTAGDVAFWFMNGAQATPAIFGNVSPSSGWTIVGDDNKGDIFWRNTDGDVGIWAMNGSQAVQQVDLANVPSNWVIAGLGDFNGDGFTDILWHCAVTSKGICTAGDLAIWFLNGTQIQSTVIVAGAVPSNWTIAQTGDYNGDGMSDILWLCTVTATGICTAGDVAVWFMNGSTVASSPGLGNVGTTWSVQSVNAE